MQRVLLGGGDRCCGLGLERSALLLELGARPNLLDQLRRLAPMEVPHLPLQLQSVSKGRVEVPGVAFRSDELVEDQHHLVMVVARLGELHRSGCGGHGLLRAPEGPEAPRLHQSQTGLASSPNDGPRVACGLPDDIERLSWAPLLHQQRGLQPLAPNLAFTSAGHSSSKRFRACSASSNLSAPKRS